jgi:OmpA-OmpF porin, OOP family
MKNVSKLMLLTLSSVFLMSACGKKAATPPTKIAEPTSNASPATNQQTIDTPSPTRGFDVSSVPITAFDIGKFPYFNAPERFKHNRSNISEFNRQFFAINGQLVPKEGRTFKAYIEPIDRERDKNNNLLLEKSYREGFLALGAVEIGKDFKITNEEIKRVGQNALLEKDYGWTVDFNQLDRIKTFLIRTTDKEIWIQYIIYGSEAEGQIAILQTEPVKALVMGTITADGIEKDLTATGKAILQVNFDTDKSTLKTDGKEVVSQINLVMQKNVGLKLAINGYTDNVGDAKHNTELSNARANAVLDALVTAGISKTRLTAMGYGDKTPIADNSTDTGKAKNRRVELVKQ